MRGEDGQTYYTRNGKFGWAIGTNGTTLCNEAGLPVLDSNGNEIVLPDGVTASSIEVSND